MKQLILLLILLTGCSSQTTTSMQTEQTALSIYQHHYSVVLFQFGQIVHHLEAAETEQDLAYAKGYMEAFLQSPPNVIAGIIRDDQHAYDKLVAKQLQPYIEHLFLDLDVYTRYLQKLDTAGIQALKPELADLYDLERELNDERYQSGEIAYEKALVRFQEILRARVEKSSNL
ncbi:hypothetical protein MUG87_18845 [Ectobacillus sp. JY-23]|uniref:hypothetical protein n=1 Tax=Ectobacillus sp. JY-23 TaxID=2933872 RepID=UPI001FF53FCA|nr:hypothetical protein [Ectobacillus sp. JY-23]UOY92448.1 hypothetical protein MUG87_18845 [Ectobacillus sp. JY-23]